MNLNWIDNVAEVRGGKKTNFEHDQSVFSNMKDSRGYHFESLLYPTDSSIKETMVHPSGHVCLG